MRRPVDGRIVDPIAGIFDGRVLIGADGRIESLERRALAAGETRYLLPGIVDLHVYDTGRAAACGITTYLATCGTGPGEATDRFLRSLPADPACGGVHLEGPYLNPEAAGAQDRSSIRPVDVDELSRWLSTGTVRMVTLAPEVEGALTAIPLIRDAGAVVALGHTRADPATLDAAVEAGATFATHVWNAMGPVASRSAGPAATLLADRRVTLGVIPDGRHLATQIERLTLGAAGPARVAATSDLVAPPGEDAAGRPVGGAVAGGGLVGRLAGYGLREAATMTSLVPSRVLGLSDRGRIAPGLRADLTVLDERFALRETIVAGATVAEL